MLSNTAKYALRALMQLALHPNEAILGRELSELTGVPANYLAKILLTLKKAGLVEATRGLGGGYRLRRPVAEVSLAEIVELFDTADPLAGCLLGQEHCSDEDPCSVHRRWCRVRAAYHDFLEDTTLAEVAGSAAVDSAAVDSATELDAPGAAA